MVGGAKGQAGVSGQGGRGGDPEQAPGPRQEPRQRTQTQGDLARKAEKQIKHKAKKKGGKRAEMQLTGRATAGRSESAEYHQGRRDRRTNRQDTQGGRTGWTGLDRTGQTGTTGKRSPVSVGQLATWHKRSSVKQRINTQKRKTGQAKKTTASYRRDSWIVFCG